jgi:hypothetical protein
LLWDSGTNTANTIGTKLGFAVAADDTSATSYISDNALSFVAPHTPLFDSTTLLVAKNMEIMIGTSATENDCIQVSTLDWSMSTPKTNIDSICAETGLDSTIINERTNEITFNALLNKYDVAKFKNFVENETVRFQFTFGSKTAGNWDAGKSGALVLRKGKITSYEIVDTDGRFELTATISGFNNDSSNEEIFLGFI